MILLLGGHVVKVGLGPLINTWLAQGIVTHVAMNGAAAIHDFELAAFGGTSEDVEAGLADGSFGMAEETGAEMNAAIAARPAHDQGMGEGLVPGAREARKRFPERMPRSCWPPSSTTSRSPSTPPSERRSSISIRRPMARAVGATSHRDFRQARRRRFPTCTRGAWCSTGAARC